MAVLWNWSGVSNWLYLRVLIYFNIYANADFQIFSAIFATQVCTHKKTTKKSAFIVFIVLLGTDNNLDLIQ